MLDVGQQVFQTYTSPFYFQHTTAGNYTTTKTSFKNSWCPAQEGSVYLVLNLALTTHSLHVSFFLLHQYGWHAFQSP